LRAKEQSKDMQWGPETVKRGGGQDKKSHVQKGKGKIRPQEKGQSKGTDVVKQGRTGGEMRRDYPRPGGAVK